MEWTVVGVLVVLLGLIGTIVRPIVSLVQNITKLTVIVDRLDRRLGEFVDKSEDEHDNMWDKIEDHETRIVVLEQGDK